MPSKTVGDTAILLYRTLMHCALAQASPESLRNSAPSSNGSLSFSLRPVKISRRRKLPAMRFPVDSRSTTCASDFLPGRALPCHQSAYSPGDGVSDKTMPRSSVPRALEGVQVPTLVWSDLPCQYNTTSGRCPPTHPGTYATLAALYSTSVCCWPDLAQSINDNQGKQIYCAGRSLHTRQYFHLTVLLIGIARR